MALDKYQRIGLNIAHNWGVKGDDTLQQKIQAMPNERAIICLLARLVVVAEELLNDSSSARIALNRIDKKLARPRKRKAAN